MEYLSWRYISLFAVILCSQLWIVTPQELFKTASRCHGDYLDLRCGPRGLLVFQSATYGRMSSMACGVKGKTGCYIDVQMYIKRKCSGRHECRMLVSEEQARSQLNNPCGGDKSYLQVKYKCIAVSQIATTCNDSHPIALTQRTSFIQSPNFPNKYPQDHDCKWQINLEKGYRVNFTIFDFELDGRRSMRCFDFLTINDNSEQAEARNAQGKTIFLDCGVILGRQISSTQGASQVNVHFSSHAGTNNRGFLMQYTVYETDHLLFEEIPAIRPATTTSGMTAVDVFPNDQIHENDTKISYMPAGIIVGVLSAIIVLLLIAVIVLLLYRKYGSKSSKPRAVDAHEKDTHETLLRNGAQPPNFIQDDDSKGRRVVMEIQGSRIASLHLGPTKNGATTLPQEDTKTLMANPYKESYPGETCNNATMCFTMPAASHYKDTGTSSTGRYKDPPRIQNYYDDGYKAPRRSVPHRHSGHGYQEENEYATIDEGAYAVSDITRQVPPDPLARLMYKVPIPVAPPAPAPQNTTNLNRKSGTVHYFEYDQGFSSRDDLDVGPPADSSDDPACYSYADNTHPAHSNMFSTFQARRHQGEPPEEFLMESDLYRHNTHYKT
ncbi:uncharacterized protein LOC135486432 isoform X2 [Lineus longissimus]|uniref:uncharacterized protein LOC135486432 isoform X2 n=1 Tax=Lineus longissimus TaxID=88925 RepID=UPI00315C8759